MYLFILIIVFFNKGLNKDVFNIQFEMYYENVIIMYTL